jgi:hypothetical protein
MFLQYKCLFTTTKSFLSRQYFFSASIFFFCCKNILRQKYFYNYISFYWTMFVVLSTILGFIAWLMYILSYFFKHDVITYYGMVYVNTYNQFYSRKNFFVEIYIKPPLGAMWISIYWNNRLNLKCYI